MSRSNRKRRSSRKSDARPKNTVSGASTVETVAKSDCPKEQDPSAPVLEAPAGELDGDHGAEPYTLPSQESQSTEIVPNEPISDVLSRLEVVLQRFDDLDGRLDEITEPLCGVRDAAARTTTQSEEHDLQHDGEIETLKTELETAWRENEELRHQNESLAAELATSNAHQTVKANIGVDESLSWEDRKALIMQQMEDDSFDANQFVDSLSGAAKEVAGIDQGDEDSGLTESMNPREFIESIVEQVNQLQSKIQDRDDEIKELQNLLQNQSETRDGGIAIGAAAIASLVDSDELIVEERERLQQLKNDWEDKFRQSEIDASLERAKLSRERQELAKRAQQLEDQIEELQREKRSKTGDQVQGRRWLTELGLGGKDN